MQLSFSEPAKWPEAYGNSAIWKRAALGDPIDLARLADHHAPETLIPLVAAGGLLGKTALAAVPYLQDPFAGGYGLCELAHRASGNALKELLHGLVTAAHNAPLVETAEPTASERCRLQLQKVLERYPEFAENPEQHRLEQTIRDLAQSALNRYTTSPG